MINAVAFREIASDDIDELAAAVADAFVGYRVFAPADWQPPPAPRCSCSSNAVAQPGVTDTIASVSDAGDAACLLGRYTSQTAMAGTSRRMIITT
jgi:hypothetical protein